MSNNALIAGRNPKTLMPIRYVAPIYSQSRVSQLNVDSGYTHLANEGWINAGRGDEGGPVAYDIEWAGPIDRSTVYDCRYTGYCDDEWRTYEEDGRVKYWYEDIDRVKIPQYIERHDLDNAKAMANQHFTNMMLVQRESLQKEWLLRRSSDRYQQKLFPMHTLGRKMG
jgi:hypothetical protein